MLAFVFPGQGSQFIGMGKSLAQRFPLARNTFEEADDALGFSLSSLCFDGDGDLNLTANAQPALVAASVAAYRVLTDETGLHPTVVAGHSLGEISALTCIESLDFASALKLARARGQAMQDAVPVGVGAMVAVIALAADDVTDICDRASDVGTAEISNYNGSGQFVVSGHSAAIARVTELATAAGGLVRPLPVSAPFHCALMAPAAAALADHLAGVEFRAPVIPIIDTASGDVIRDGDSTGSRLIDQVCAPVRWDRAMKTLAALSIEQTIEVGPSRRLCSLINRDAPQLGPVSFGEADDFASVMSVKAARPLAVSPIGQWKLDPYGNSFDAENMAVVWAGQHLGERIGGPGWTMGAAGTWLRNHGPLAYATGDGTFEILDPTEWFAREDGAYVRRDLSCIMAPGRPVEHLVPDEWSLGPDDVMVRRDGTRTIWSDGLEWRFQG